jgi:hypothetical protein
MSDNYSALQEHLLPDRNEYIDKYLFPFEKKDLENIGTQYFELLNIPVSKSINYKSYISGITIPSDIKYCALDYKYDKYIASEVEFKIFENINAELDVILPHTQIEYLYCGFQVKNIAAYTNLKTLILECDIYYPLNDLPASLIRLEILVPVFIELNNLPPNLKVLRINAGGLNNYCFGYPYPLNNLPSGLEILYFPETKSMDGKDYLANLDNLPILLKYLYLPTYFNLSESTNFDTIPNSVEVIEFHHYPEFVEKINKYPASLKKIYTNCCLEPKDIELIKNSLVKKQYFGKFEIYTNIIKYDKFDFYINGTAPNTKEYKLIFEISR